MRTAHPTPQATALDRELDAFTFHDWSLLAGLALIWGSSFVLIEVGLRGFAPAQIAFLRALLGMATLALLPRARRPVARAAWPRLALLGLTWLGVPMLLFPIAQQWIDSSLAGMLNGGVPLWAALIATLLARRLPPPGVRIGLAAGFAGILLVGLPNLQTSGSSARGVLLIVVATVLYGLSLNLAVPLQRAHGSLPVMLRAHGVAAIFCLPFAALVPVGTVRADSALAILSLGVLSTGVALAMMTSLAGRVGAARASIAIYLVPVVAIALGAIFLGEHVHPLALGGTALVIVGAAIASRGQRALK